MIARCIPDVANFAKYSLTSFPNTPTNSALVSAGICTQTDASILNDGFRSFPSGHASFSAAGLIYLSLFLASKFAITIPFLSPRAYSTSSAQYYSAFPSRLPPTSKLSPSSSTVHGKTLIPTPDIRLIPTNTNTGEIAARNQAAAPPVYLLVVAFIPTATAIFIAATRYCDFRHHGFDIISGFVIGLLNAVFAFRVYHLPVSQGAGWSWGPRSRARAWWAGVGRGSYVGVDEEEGGVRKVEGVDADMDVEMQDLEGGRTPMEGRGGRDDNVRT
jgi:membrane-associated phospholipid phosphatase